MNRDRFDKSSQVSESAWLRQAQVIDQFEDRWHQSGAASIAEFLAHVPAEERALLLYELIKVDLEYRWQRGERRLIEEYVAEFPELGESATLPVELVQEELRVRESLGCPATADEIGVRFPGRETELADAAQTVAMRPDSHSTQSRPTVPLRDGEGTTTSTVGPTGDLPPLRQLGHYELRGRIGHGGFAIVYRAWDLVLHREVAIKLPRADLLLDSDTKQRSQREAERAARLRHPGIVQIHEVGQHGDCPYIVYALLPGPTLAEFAKTTSPTPQQAAQWVLRIAEALDYAHQAGIVHRDVKPSNILLDHDGQPALADFGLALDSSAVATLTQHGDILGTPAYMSPEQAAGRGHEVDGRTDVYGLGVVLYELLCGQVPFQGSGASVLHRVLHDEPRRPRQLRGTVPTDLETICLKAMAKEPSRRYATAGEMASDVRAYLEHRPIRARRVGPLAQMALWCRRNPLIAATIMIAASITVGVTTVSFLRVVAERNRFRRERESAIANLYDSLVREARAIRLARGVGFRHEAWDRLQRAMQLETPALNLDLLRQEAAACLGDFVGERPAVWSGFHDINHVVTSQAFGGKNLIAIGFLDGAVELRDLSTGAIKVKLAPHDTGVFGLAFSLTGETLVSMDDRGLIKVWIAEGDDRSSWELVRTFQTAPSGEPRLIVAVWCALTPDAGHVLACAKGEASIRMWNIATGELTRELRGLNNELFIRGALSPDGRTLIGAFRGAESDGIIVWDIPTRELRRKLAVTKQAIIDVAFSGDGMYLAAGSNVGTFVFDTQEWKQRTFIRGDDQFFTIAFHPRNPILAIPVARTSVIRLWDVVANRETATLGHPGGPHSVAFSPDGLQLVSATGKEVRLWDLDGRGEKQSFSGHLGLVTQVLFSPDGKLLASASRDGSVKLWDAATCHNLSAFSITPAPVPTIARISFHPDGKRLAAGDWLGNVAIFDVSSPQQPKQLIGLVQDREMGHIIWDVQYSPDGRYIAVAGQNGVWLWRGDERIAVVTTADSTRVQFSSNSRRLLSTDRGNGLVRLWDIETSKPEVLSEETRLDSALALPPDKHLVIVEPESVANPLPQLTVIDMATGKRSSEWPQQDPPPGKGGSDPGLGLQRNSIWTNHHDNQLVIWDLATKRLLLSLPDEATPVETECWSPDRKRLAVGLTDGNIAIWDLSVVHRQLEAIGLGW